MVLGLDGPVGVNAMLTVAMAMRQGIENAMILHHACVENHVKEIEKT